MPDWLPSSVVSWCLAPGLANARPTSFPESFISPPQRERGKEDPGSGWSRVLVTNLFSWEGSQFIRLSSRLVFVRSKPDSLGNLGKLSFDFATKLYHIYYVAFNSWNWVWKLWKDENVKLWLVILFDTRCLLHRICSIALLLNEKRTVMLFALPMA